MVQRADSGTDLLSQPKPAGADGDMPRSYRLDAEAQTVGKIQPLFQDMAYCSSETIDEDGPEEELIEYGTEEDELDDLDDEDETEDWGEDEDEDDELDDDDDLDDEEPYWDEDDLDDDMTEEIPLVEDDLVEE